MDGGLGLDCGGLLVDDDLELGVGLAPHLALAATVGVVARGQLAVEVLPLVVNSIKFQQTAQCVFNRVFSLTECPVLC